MLSQWIWGYIQTNHAAGCCFVGDSTDAFHAQGEAIKIGMEPGQIYDGQDIIQRCRYMSASVRKLLLQLDTLALLQGWCSMQPYLCSEGSTSCADEIN